MLTKEASAKALKKLFRRSSVVDLEALYRTLKTGSRMSVFRRLREFDYLSSYTHAGRYYTLAGVPRFDEQDLWFYRDIGFSRAGTLKNTTVHLVEVSEAGRTHRELEEFLRVRVHNALLSSVHEQRIDRQRVERTYLYTSIEPQQAAHQIATRRELVASAAEVSRALSPSTIIEVLVQVLQTGQARVGTVEVAKRLTERGLPVTAQQVGQILGRYGLDPEKKTAQ